MPGYDRVRGCYVRNPSSEGIAVERFVLVAVSTAGGPASLRVQVWRKLRSLGAVYVQQSVCLLPAREPVLREVRRLAAKVRADGGTARTLTVEISDPGEYKQLIAEFDAARDVEYAEVVERVPALLAEIATETAKGRTTYAEVEESEADLDRFHTWLAKIAARDYFAAAGGQAAREAVARCEQAVAEFEQAALRAEAGPAVDTAQREASMPLADGRLRAVNPRGRAGRGGDGHALGEPPPDQKTEERPR